MINPKLEHLNPYNVYMDLIKNNGLFQAKKHAYDTFNEVYFNRQPNEHSMVLSRFKDVLKGKFYTFNYLNPLNKDKLEFYDRRPIILVTNTEYYAPTKHHLVTGINFNFIPNEVKIFMIDKLFKSFEKLILSDIRRNKDNERMPIPKDLFNPNFDYYGLVKYVFNTLLKSNFNFAVRKYIWNKSSFIKNIDYEHWGYIPLLDSKMTVGLSIEQIYQLYWQERNKKIKL